MQRTVNAIIRTNGQGVWSSKVANVRVVRVSLLEREPAEGAKHQGVLNVYFDPATWDIRRDDLIYTDPGFADGVQALLPSIGIRGDVDYNEQGMQGDDYVSFDVWGDFSGFQGDNAPEVKAEPAVLKIEAPSPTLRDGDVSLRDVNPNAAFELDEINDRLARLETNLARGGAAQRAQFFQTRDRADAAEARVKALEAVLARFADEDDMGVSFDVRALAQEALAG